MQTALQAMNPWPLLRQLITIPDEDVRRAVLLMVAALCRHQIANDERQYWANLVSLEGLSQACKGS